MRNAEQKISNRLRKSRSVIFFVCCFFFACSQSSLAGTIVSELNSQWRFRKSGDKEWMSATVPGTVHTDLFENKKIPDPFFGTNEKDIQWIDTCNWEYEMWFDAGAEIISNYNCELQFEGLDTYAKVYLNDSLILTADNMFRTWKIQCNKILKPQQNHLVVIFESAVKRGRELAKKNSVVLPGDEKVYSRKAQYQYGWDWGPRFVGFGIWRPVKFIAWNVIRINSVQLTHEILNDSLAEIDATVDVTADKPSIVYFKVLVEGLKRDSFYFERLLVNPSSEKMDLEFKIKNPLIWSCNGSEEQKLYQVNVQVMNPDHESDVIHSSYGIRTVDLVQKKDADGESFYFKINGDPVFMQGANWIPADHFLPRVTKDKYRELLLAAKDANMNMIRVWGGGVYEDNAFYDLCDSLGILVWQDFMFACAMYPGDSSFLSNVQSEITDNVIRLRNHPCIALWCGNNEIDEGWKNWGWQKQFSYSQKDSAAIWKNYLILFHSLIPGLLSSLDPERPYWESSLSIGWGHDESLRSGDSHYWGVWWGLQPFEMYEKKVGRFVSEYGFQGMPSLKSIEAFTPAAERNTGSASMKNHQKHPAGFETIDHYMNDWYKKPKNFESYVYISQLLQAEGMKKAIEAHRRAKPYCMGTLYWQLDDCWPVTSWSSIDYSGTWKALHYAVKKSFEKYLISVSDSGKNFTVYVISDDSINQRAMLKISAIDFSGKLLWSDSALVKMSHETVVPGYVKSLEGIISKCDPTQTVIRMQLVQDKNILSQNLYYFRKPKDLHLDKTDIDFTVKSIEGSQGTMELRSKHLSKNVFLDTASHGVTFKENYFDLLPGETKTIQFQTQLSEAELKKQLIIQTVADTY
jgi:beta-mannosidase